jgi:hypothetical protein
MQYLIHPLKLKLTAMPLRDGGYSRGAIRVVKQRLKNYVPALPSVVA